MTDVRERAVEGDAVADVNVEAVLPVGLVHPVRVCQRESLPLLTVTWVRHRQTGCHERRTPAFAAFVCEASTPEPKLEAFQGLFLCVRLLA